jgi:sugar phosphate isomerase/epimerase
MATAAFGCNTYSYIRSESAVECVGRLAAHGFREFELMVHPGHLWPDLAGEELARLRVLFAGGLELTTLNMPNIDINIAAAAEGMRRYSLGLLRDLVRLAGELGARGVVIGPGKANPLFPAPAQELTGHFFAALDLLCPLAEKAGTALWLENMPFAFLPGIDELVAALERYGNAHVGIVYDVANAHFIGEDIRYGLERCGTRLGLVHLSDTGRQHYRHDPVGRGDVSFAAIPAMLADIGYRRRPMLEIISPDGDAAILDSAARLGALGFHARAGASA